MLAAGDLNIDLIMTGLSSLPIAGRGCCRQLYLAMGGSRQSAPPACPAGPQNRLCRKGGRRFLRPHMRRLPFLLRRRPFKFNRRPKSPNRYNRVLTATDNPDRALATYLGSIDGLLADDIPDALLSKAKHIHVGSFFLQSNLRKGLAGLFERARALG